MSRDLGVVAWKLKGSRKLFSAGHETEIVHKTRTGRVKEKNISLAQILNGCHREVDSIFVSIADQPTAPITLESFIS